jgi:signal transduction histidine kinase
MSDSARRAASSRWASLRLRLALLTMVIVFIPVYLLNRQARETFDAFTRRVWEEEMIHVAKITGRLCAGPQGQDAAFLRDLLRRAELDTGIRLRWIGPDGQVRVDSLPEAESDEVARQWRPGPEVATALGGRYQARWELTPDRSYTWYHCAQPILIEGQVVGVMHASRHTGPIMRAILRMLARQRATTALAVALAAGASLALALTITRRLRRLTAAVGAMARGEAGGPVPAGGGDEVAELSRGFNHLRDELARRNRYNRDFFAVVLHELQSPLTAIRGAAAVLRDGADARPGARETFLANIEHQAGRLTRLVGELNELNRLETGGEEELPRVRADLAAAVAGMLDRAAPAYAGRATLRGELGHAPVEALIHAESLEQVLVNLLDNAFRHAPADGTVTVRLLPADGSVELVVEDSGPGISPCDLPRVFEPFFTTARKHARENHRRGLGLAIARAIVTRHAGTIRAEHRPEGGARFTVTLPRST